MSLAQSWLEHETIFQLPALHGEVDAVTQFHLRRAGHPFQQRLGPSACMLQMGCCEFETQLEHSSSRSEGMGLASSFEQRALPPCLVELGVLTCM